MTQFLSVGSQDLSVSETAVELKLWGGCLDSFSPQTLLPSIYTNSRTEGSVNKSATDRGVRDIFQSGTPSLLKMHLRKRIGVIFMTFIASLLVPIAAGAGFDRWFAQEVEPAVRGITAERIDGNISLQHNGKASSRPSAGTKQSFDACLVAGTLCSVAYSGVEGASLRRNPSETNVLAAAYPQNSVPLKVLSESPVYVNGAPWVEVQLNGWMALRKLSRSVPYLAEIAVGKARVDWEGERLADNFIALKTAPDYLAKRIAKVFNGTEVEVGNIVVQGEFEWISAQLHGWMAAKSPQGTVLLQPYSP